MAVAWLLYGCVSAGRKRLHRFHVAVQSAADVSNVPVATYQYQRLAQTNMAIRAKTNLPSPFAKLVFAAS